MAFVISSHISQGIPWFRGRDVCDTLQYTNARKAIRDHVDDCDVERFVNLLKSNPLHPNENELYINESGLYTLILRSKKAEAKVFQRWVTSHLLPSLRKNSYTENHLSLTNERSLHYAVVSFVRSYIPSALLSIGLVKLQDTKDRRTDAYFKGYRGGQPDIIILNAHRDYTGFALELKTPNGKGRLTDHQASYLQDLKKAEYKVLVSESYNEIVVELLAYFQNVRYSCHGCRRKFKSPESLASHVKYFHR